MIFGEADFLPGLVVDKFEDVLVVQSLALGIDRLKGTIIEALIRKVLAEDGIQIRGVYERSDAKVRKQEGMELTQGIYRRRISDTCSRLRKMVSDIRSMSRTDRRPDFSWIRNTIVLRSRSFVKMREYWTALHIQVLLH